MHSNVNILACNMSIKVHNYIDRFLQNLGKCSEEQDEIFHQDIKTMKIDIKDNGIAT